MAHSAQRPRRLFQGVARVALAIAALAAGATAAQAADTPLSGIDRLIAEDDIRQQLSLYGLLADGDGIKGKDTRTLADKIMAPDVVTEVFYPGGKPPVRMLGRDAVAGPPLKATTPDVTVTRHYLVDTYFESLTATTAKTVTTAVHFNLTRNLAGPDCAKGAPGACGGIPKKITMWIYHMDWVKNAAGWQVTYNGLRLDN